MRILSRTLVALLLAVCAGGVYAQAYPSKPIRFVVPYPPGGSNDVLTRITAQAMAPGLGQQIVIDNRGGAGGMIGADHVAKSAPDGYTVGMVNSSLAVNPSLRKSMPYNTTRDIAGVTQLANLQLAIVARPDAPFNTLAELIAYAKKHPRKLTYGTPGAGSTTHLGAELLKREAGFDMLHSPFKGSAPAHTELMGGRIDLVVDPFLSVLPYVKAGRMKIIATLGEKRVAGYEKDYPNAAETLPGFNVTALLGFVVPAATPRPVVARLQTDIARVVALPDIRKRMDELGMEPVASTPAQFDAFIQAEMKKWARVIAEAKIEAEN